MDKHSLSWESLLRTAILSGFLGLLVWLATTKQIILYTNPKMSGLAELSGFLLFLLLLPQAIQLARPHPQANAAPLSLGSACWRYLPFLVVLALAFLIPNNTLSTSLINNKGLNSQLASAKDAPRPLAQKFHQTQQITITDTNYVEAVREITHYPQDYEGKEVFLSGFLHKNEDGKSFSLARYMIVCCASDALPFGLSAEITDLSSFPEGSWVNLQGTIHAAKNAAPVIATLSLTQSQQPINPYLYW